MVTITQRPTKTNEALTSKWTAAHNPVIYKFQRRDRDILSVIVAGSQLRISLNDATGLEVGTSVYVSTTKYKGAALIEIIIDDDIWVSGITPNGSDGAGYLNDTRRNYRIDIKIYESGNNKLLGATSCVPFNTGAGTKDLGVYVAAYLKLVNTFTYDAINKRDVNGSIKFYITFQEIWTGGIEDLQTDVASPIFAVNAARQIGEQFGQNMHPFVVVFPTTRTAKFLTKFKRPVYFTGKPFSIGFIYSELVSVQLHKVEQRLDVNKLQVSEVSTPLDTGQRESVNSLMLDEGYAANVRYVRLKLTSGAPVTEEYVYPGYVLTGYVAKN
jgi:hypothetical protein